jgi:hypothetical protein
MVDSVSDAIMAELLGEVGQLRDEIKGLSADLAEPLQAIADATQSGRTAVETHTVDKKNELQALSQKERVVMEQLLVDAVNKACGDLERAGQRMAREIGRPDGLPGWVQIAIALAIAAIAGIISLYGGYWMFGGEQERQAAMGRAVMAAWDSLDAKAKEKIEAFYE